VGAAPPTRGDAERAYPWVTNFNLKSGTGTIVGVIGGYQEGGATDAVSYSAYLDDDIRRLYEQAQAAG